MIIKNIYNEIITEFEKKINPKRVEKDKYYHKVGNPVSYGLSSPEYYKIIKKYKHQFKELGTKDILKLAGLFYKSKISEQVYTANYILSLRSDIFTPNNLNFLDKSLEYFDNWGVIDDFSIHVMQPILIKYPKHTMNLLRKWNKSKNLWKRRVSVVVFTRKIGESGKFTKEALELCNRLLDDKEDLVQKGVGWALKDNMRGNKRLVFDFVKKLRKLKISSVITLYALRDINGCERIQVLSSRS